MSPETQSHNFFAPLLQLETITSTTLMAHDHTRHLVSLKFEMKFNSLQDAMADYLTETKLKKVEDLTEALLDGHAIPELGDVAFLTKCTKLGYLSLNKCSISKLPVFPAGLAIERLELSDNKLHGSLESLHNLEHLEELHIGGNQFDSISQLKPLSKLANLRILDITECPVLEKDSEIHSEIFKLIPTLEAFNGKDETGESVDFEDGSSDLDDYSDEDDSDEDGSSDEDDENDEEDSEDDEDDEEGDDEEASDEQRPAKAARHD